MRPDTHRTLLATILLALMFHGARAKCHFSCPAGKCDAQGRCTDCLPATGLDAASGTCMPCADDSCLRCTANFRRCTECYAKAGERTLYADRAGTCRLCTGDCDMKAGCAADGSCKVCAAGFVKSGADCVQCAVEGCVQCPTRSTCKACKPGFAMLVDNTTGTGVIQCVACAGNTDGRCLVCGRGFRCQLCADGYYLDASKLCKPCPSDCGPATSVDELPGTCTGPAKCTRCRAPYTGVSGGACSRCTDSSCMDCATDASQCRKCWPGSTVHPVTKRCVDCAGYGCATCSGPTTKLCLSCFTGHGLIAPPGQAEGRCGRCQAAGCAACDGNLYQCTRCVDGQEAFGIYGLAFQWDPATRRCIALDSIAPTGYS